MSAQPAHPFMTADEYLAFERAAHYKNEFIAGEIVAMSGATRRHDRIVVNLIADLVQALRDEPCEVFTSDMRVKVRSSNYFYPDLTVTCGEPQIEDVLHMDTLVNPTVVFEVLSGSTESRDRGIKWRLYQQIESLRHYVLIDQNMLRVELYSRQPEGDWLLHSITSRDGQVELPAIGVAIAMARLYESVKLPADVDLEL